MGLPVLNDVPFHRPDCCLSLSTVLIAELVRLLPCEPEFTLSIGSGSGLLEALIMQHGPMRTVTGVEVNSTVNKYMPEESVHVVTGTRDLCRVAAAAYAWLFVYPREPKLVAQYLQLYSDTTVQLVVWLGPRADWEDHEPLFRSSAFNIIEIPQDCGLAPYEMMAAITKGTSKNK